ncbi:MAG TPA: PDZ domain-containing protein [Gemmatimonadales bacterium]|nr:PDZ domain-containing protein [Gemmatimonadales bacterium]
MKHSSFLLSMSIVSAAAVLSVSPGLAQDRTVTAPGVSGTYRVVSTRPSLGLSISTRPTEFDSIGVLIEGVTPGGPAQRAGIRSGDIITRLNGQPLALPARGVRGGPPPGLRLIEMSARLAPHDTITLQLRRGVDTRNVRLAAEPRHELVVVRDQARRQEDAVLELRSRVEELQGGLTTSDFRGMERSALATRAYFSLIGGLQLAPLNPELGRYFGTDSGVLVISVPRTSALQLRGGDVVQRIDGREPDNPAHLLRILGSYGPDEEFTLEIMRDRKRQSLTTTMRLERE